MEKSPVRKIGKYEIISKVAEGGMGSLYKARHPTLNRVVLLKKLTLRGGSLCGFFHRGWSRAHGVDRRQGLYNTVIDCPGCSRP